MWQTNDLNSTEKEHCNAIKFVFIAWPQHCNKLMKHFAAVHVILSQQTMMKLLTSSSKIKCFHYNLISSYFKKDSLN